MIKNNCANLHWNLSKIAGVMVRTKIWPSSVTLTLGLPERIFQITHLPRMENNCVTSFWSPLTTAEAMVQTNSDGQTLACMHGRCIYTKLLFYYVLLTTSGLHNNVALIVIWHIGLPVEFRLHKTCITQDMTLLQFNNKTLLMSFFHTNTQWSFLIYILARCWESIPLKSVNPFPNDKS